jgi:hypothetical protein
VFFIASFCAVTNRSLFPSKKLHSMANPVSVPINALRSSRGGDTDDVGEMQRMQMQQTRGPPVVSQKDDDDAAIKEVLAEINAETERVTRDNSSVSNEKYREMNAPTMHPSVYQDDIIGYGQQGQGQGQGHGQGGQYMQHKPVYEQYTTGAGAGAGTDGGHSMFSNAVNNLARDMKLFMIVAVIVLMLESSMLDGLIFSRVASRVSIPYIGVMSKMVFAVIVFAIMRSLLI